MEPVTAAVMVLLSCTTDSLFCRKVPQPPAVFSSVADCEAMLPLEIRRLGTGNGHIVGTCQILAKTTDRVRWAKLPDSTVVTSVEREADEEKVVSVGRMRTDENGADAADSVGSTRIAVDQDIQAQMPEAHGEGFVTVYVTRLGGGAVVTTSHSVKRSD